jgi:hypothetical protein
MAHAENLVEAGVAQQSADALGKLTEGGRKSASVPDRTTKASGQKAFRWTIEWATRILGIISVVAAARSIPRFGPLGFSCSSYLGGRGVRGLAFGGRRVESLRGTV